VPAIRMQTCISYGDTFWSQTNPIAWGVLWLFEGFLGGFGKGDGLAMATH